MEGGGFFLVGLIWKKKVGKGSYNYLVCGDRRR